MNCKKCGTVLENDDLFCPVCGTPVERKSEGWYLGETVEIPTPTEPEPPNELRCSKCGELLMEDDLYCPVCGASVVGEEPTPIIDPPPFGGNPEEMPTTQPSKPEPIPQPPKAEPTSQLSKSVSIEDDLLERHELVILTRQEVINGCQKILDIDGQQLIVDIEPRFDIKQSKYFEGYGYRDDASGAIGNLKVDFIIG